MERHVTATQPPRADQNIWRTLLPEWYLRHLLRPPPRRWSFFIQLWLDVSGPVVPLIWAVSAGLFFLGYALRSWVGAPVIVCILVAYLGACLLIFWLTCFLLAVRSMWNDRIGTGVIRSLMRPNPVLPGASIASVLLPDGRAIEVGVQTALVADFLERDGQCEVLFKAGVNSPTAEGVVLAAREIKAPAGARTPSRGASGREETDTILGIFGIPIPPEDGLGDSSLDARVRP